MFTVVISGMEWSVPEADMERIWVQISQKKRARSCAGVTGEEEHSCAVFLVGVHLFIHSFTHSLTHSLARTMSDAEDRTGIGIYEEASWAGKLQKLAEVQ